MDNELEFLTGFKFRIGRSDCFQHCQLARMQLGRKPLDPINNYIGKDHSAMILGGVRQYQRREGAPVDGDIVIAQGALEVILGTYCDGMVLLFNAQRVSALVPISEVDILGIYSDQQR